MTPAQEYATGAVLIIAGLCGLCVLAAVVKC